MVLFVYILRKHASSSLPKNRSDFARAPELLMLWMLSIDEYLFVSEEIQFNEKKEDEELKALKITHYFAVIIVCGALYIFSILILLLEILYFSNCRSTKI